MGAVVTTAIVVFTGTGVTPTIIAVLAGMAIFRMGFALLGGMIQPIPEPPPAGELRKVKIQFRCTLCGTEVRMTVANDEIPDAPKHCMEEMDFVAPVE